MATFTSLEICAGAGGQAVGLEQAGFEHVALVEIEPIACQTLLFNRPEWNVIRADVKGFDGTDYAGIDLLAGGVPCPPFSVAGKQLGNEDERDLFPEALRLVAETNPKAILLENVKGLLDKKFDGYRNGIIEQLEFLGYRAEWRLINAADYGVSQSRPRAILVALKPVYYKHFAWPLKNDFAALSIGELLYKEMTALGWKQAEAWREMAANIAPTLVGGSKKHGGADLGPTGARKAWAKLGVDGRGISDLPPSRDFIGMPRLTVNMAAKVQGFPDGWKILGKKTPAYKQVGNAFPPPVAKAVGESIIKALINGKPRPAKAREKTHGVAC